MKKIMLLMCFLCITLATSVIAVPIQDANIRGYVYIDSNPTANLDVVAKINSVEVASAKTDGNGYYSIDVSYPKYSSGDTAVLTAKTGNNEGSIEVQNIQTGNNGLYNNIDITTVETESQTQGTTINEENTEDEVIVKTDVSNQPTTAETRQDADTKPTQTITLDIPPKVKEDAVKTAAEEEAQKDIQASANPVKTEKANLLVGITLTFSIIILGLIIFFVYGKMKNKLGGM